MKNFVLMPKQTVFTGSSVSTVLIVLFSLIANWTFSQTTTYSASTSSWTTSPTVNASCSGTLLANTIKHRVSISGSTANFEVAKVNGTFSSAGTVFIKDASCGTVLNQVNFAKGVSSVSISTGLNYTSGSRNFVATINSNTGDKFYTNSLSITATTTEPPTNLSANPTSLSFPSNGGTQYVDVSTNKSYSISGSVGGFTIQGIASNRIMVTASSNENPNATTQNRSGSFNIIAGSGSIAKTVSISLSQAGKVVAPQTTLSVSPTSLGFTSSGGTKSITVTSNANWTVSGSASGFTITPIASNRIDVTATINENATATTQARSGSFTITAGTGTNTKTQKIDLSQDGKVYVAPSLGGFKVIGYLFYFTTVDKIDFSKMTHVNLSFLNPVYDASTINQKWVFDDNKTEESIPKIRSKNKNIKIFLSLGGSLGSGGPYFQNGQKATTEEQKKAKKFYDDWKLLLANQTYRKNAVEAIAKKMDNLGLDGVDVDLEWYATSLPQYDIFINELYEQVVTKYKKQLTITVEPAKSPADPNIKYPTNTTLNKADWVNIMSYDGKPYAGSYKWATSTGLSLSSSKIVMGLHLAQHGKSVATYTQRAKFGGDIDGITMKPCLGVMIWEVGDPNSTLLSDIYKAATTVNARIGVEETINQSEITDFYAYPNPTNNGDWIDFNKEVSYQILDEKTSQVVMSSDENVKGCNIGKLSSGRYIIRTNEGQVFRLVK